MLQSRSWVGILVAYAWFATGAGAQTTDMNGAWAQSADACAKVFVKSGNRISFARNAHRHGVAFILEDDRIRGRVATCRVAWRKDDPKQFDAKCTANVFDAVNFTLRVIDDNTIGRIRQGAEPQTFVRCSL
jgi:hypothetical protein